MISAKFLGRRPNQSWLLCCVVLATCTWSLVVLHLKISEARRGGGVAVVVPVRDAASSVLPTPSPLHGPRRVTKSLAQLGLPPGRLSDHVVFFNRVPKAGGEMLVLLMQWLQGANGFRHIRLPGGHVRKLTKLQQEDLVEEVTMAVRRQAVPVSFDRHVYFLNFSQFDRESPTFINLVRDPVEKALSRFYYSRVTANPRNPDVRSAPTRRRPQRPDTTFEKCVLEEQPECSFVTGQHYDLAIPYFCGHEAFCTELNNDQSLSVAKANVERYFPVVGVLEDLNATLAVLENKLPYFFKGVQGLYFKELLEPHKNRNKRKPASISPAVRAKLESSLSLEFSFYHWLRKRLFQQHETQTPRVTPRVTKYLMPDHAKNTWTHGTATIELLHQKVSKNIL